MTMPLFGPGGRGERGGGAPEGPRVHRVAEVNRLAKRLLASRFLDLWIEGELSDVTRARTGHVYFTLSDERASAQLKGVMFQGDAQRAKAKLVPGARVRLRGELTIYEPRGTFQFIARTALPVGDGDLAARFAEIKRRLDADGLFAAERKRALPRLPRVVGVVTSRSGAALHDVVRVTNGRCPLRLVIADCRVQGEQAPGSIVRALTAIQRLEDLDVVIVTRGGGSAEELWAFNDEHVARAVAACRVPTVVGVGHESDVTLAELVADRRAATPSNAAEIVVPEKATLEAELDGERRHLVRAMETRVGRLRLRLERLSHTIGDPRGDVGRRRRDLERLRASLDPHGERRVAAERRRIAALEERLREHDPRTRLATQRRALDKLAAKLENLAHQRLEDERRRLERHNSSLLARRDGLLHPARRKWQTLGTQLDALSPLKVLDRGYAIALHRERGHALRDVNDAEVGDRLQLRLAHGSLVAEVVAKTPEDP